MNNFFYYSKRERRVIIFFLFLAMASVVVYFILSSAKIDEGRNVTDAEREEIDKFIEGLKEINYKDSIKRYKYYTKEEVVLTSFDPNKADSISLRRLGIPGYVIRNILKYRAAGGNFKDVTAFSKIYGLKEELYNKLKPFISISPDFIEKKDSFLHKKNDSIRQYKFDKLISVDLNAADTSILKMIPGIGSGIARMIIAYRTKLGGYYSVNQLDEIGYVDKKLYEWFSVETPIDDKNKILVNSFSLDRLRNHPYMNFYKAKVIVEYRRKRGKIKNLSQIALFEEFTEKDLDRLSKYLYFD